MSRKGLLLLGTALLVAAVGFVAAHYFTRPAAGRLVLQIETKPLVMSAAYKVYANREAGDGRYWLAKVILRNEGESPLENVTVSYEVPGLVPSTTPRTYPELLPGQTAIALYYPRFPESVATKTTSSTEQIGLRVEYGNRGARRQESRQMDFQLRARNDMVYTTLPDGELLFPQDWYENTDMVAAFVTPDDPLIKYFVQQLEQKVMGGTTVGAGAEPEEVLRFMNAVYAFWVANGVVYAGTEGLPEKIGRTTTMIQHVRLPREVLIGQAGLCVELAATFASIAQAAGLEPIIVTTARHAWPAIKLGDSIIPIEATAVGMPGRGQKPASFEQAVRAGQKNMQIWQQGGDEQLGPATQLFDIADLHRKGIVPPELTDDAALKQRIDEAFARLLGGRRTARVAAADDESARPARPARPAGPGETATGVQRYDDPRGYFSVAVPRTWSIAPMPNPQTPWVALVASDPAAAIGIEVYVFTGIESEEQALAGIQSSVVSGGGVFNYTDRGTSTLRGRSYRRFTGFTGWPIRGSAGEWEAYIRATSGYTVVLSLDAPQGQLSGALPVLRPVASTFSMRS